MTKRRCVTYLRVSTGKQGANGLGIEAQRETVARYLDGHGLMHLSEFVEVESGRRSDRPVLDKALAEARLHRVPLVVAKVDRLTRSVAFLSRLLESGVDVRFCDLPQIEGPAGRFMLQQMAAVAELEAGMISARTKAALAAAKANGKVLGGFRGHIPDAEATKEAREAQTAKAQAQASRIAPVIAELRAAGITSATGIARALTERNIPTARGSERWTTVQVQRVMARIP